MKNAFDVVRDFEAALCEYTGAPYCVTTNSCTEALGMSMEYHKGPYRDKDIISMPKRTYVGVGMQAKRLGYIINFQDIKWSGIYEIFPLGVYDAAKRFRRGMFREIANTRPGDNIYVCLSFHYTKILSLTQGGCILHNDSAFDDWARQMRFDGREECEPAGNEMQYDVLGRHCYMGPEVAALGLRKLMAAKDFNEDLPMDNYPDLSKIEVLE